MFIHSFVCAYRQFTVTYSECFENIKTKGFSELNTAYDVIYCLIYYTTCLTYHKAKLQEEDKDFFFLQHV